VIDLARLARPWKEIRRELLHDPEFSKAYENLGYEFQAARSIIALRSAKGTPRVRWLKEFKIKRYLQ